MAKEKLDPRTGLLEATMDYVAKHGVGDLTLRQLASALGTSHRMLVYHFGSKEGLLTEVVREVERRQREAIALLYADLNLSPSEIIRRAWRRFADPSLWPNERLFFEVYGQALRGLPHTTKLLDEVIEAWIVPVAAAGVRAGLPKQVARADARLAIAVVRGLLLDLLATGDRKETDQAMERFILGREVTIAAAAKTKPARRK